MSRNEDKDTRPFFFRLEPSALLSALILIPEAERGAWITRVAVELATKEPVEKFAVALYDEAIGFQSRQSERNRLAGLESARKRSLSKSNVC